MDVDVLAIHIAVVLAIDIPVRAPLGDSRANGDAILRFGAWG